MDETLHGARDRSQKIGRIKYIDWVEIFARATFGLEYELVAANRRLRAKRVSLDTPMSVIAKKDPMAELAPGIEGVVTEGGNSIREVITRAAAICAANIENIPRAMQGATQRFFKKHGYNALPVSAVLTGARGRTKAKRYEKFLDQIGLSHVVNTASIQINLGTIDNEDLRARAVGLMGNYSHLFLALSASSPFVERRHNEFLLRRRIDDKKLIDAGIASYHTFQMQHLLTAAMPGRYTSKAEYDKARDERLALYKKHFGEIPENPNSYDYVLIRMTDFGAELRVTDNIRTPEELELATIMASATWAHVLKRIRDHPDHNPEQSSMKTRTYAHFHAAMSGMESNLVPPESSEEELGGEPGRTLDYSYKVIWEHLEKCREALELVDPSGADKMIARAGIILARLQKVKTADMRDRGALQYFRQKEETSLNSQELTDKEGVYLHCFALAEHHYGLFEDQQFLREKAYEWHELALTTGLTLDTIDLEFAPTG